MSHPKVSVIGCGHWGKNLIRNFKSIGSLVSICDLNYELANKIGEEFDVKVESFDDILKSNEVEGVVIASPAQFHCELGVKALNAKKNIFVEKPLALNLVEADKLISCSIENDKILMVGHLLQYHSAFKKLKDLIFSNEYGNLKYVTSSRLSLGKIRSNEDVIWSFAPHDISMALSLVNSSPVSVFCVASRILNEELVDDSTLIISFKNGVKAKIMCSWISPFKEQKLSVMTNDGSFIFDDTSNWKDKLKFLPFSINTISNERVIKKEAVKDILLEESEPLRNECIHFLDLISGKVKNITDGREGKMVLNILTAASESLLLGKEISLDL